jgi:Uncharacterized protein conserved in bacteria
VIIDTSAFVAILFNEDGADELARRIAADPIREMSALSYLELCIVVESRKGRRGFTELESLLGDLGVEVGAFDLEQAKKAFSAWRRFGKGRHPAALNLGDCCTYAYAEARGGAILFKGEDFEQTDCMKA